jgi:hypothetical protein
VDMFDGRIDAAVNAQRQAIAGRVDGVQHLLSKATGATKVP